jgi:hypothetical protein
MQSFHRELGSPRRVRVPVLLAGCGCRMRSRNTLRSLRPASHRDRPTRPDRSPDGRHVPPALVRRTRLRHRASTKNASSLPAYRRMWTRECFDPPASRYRRAASNRHNGIHGEHVARAIDQTCMQGIGAHGRAGSALTARCHHPRGTHRLSSIRQRALLNPPARFPQTSIQQSVENPATRRGPDGVERDAPRRHVPPRARTEAVYRMAAARGSVGDPQTGRRAPMRTSHHPKCVDIR